MKKLPYILYGLLIIGVIGMLVYDYLPDQRIETSDLTRAGLLLVGFVLGIQKAGKPRRGLIRDKKVVYSNAYSQYIQNVFPEDKKASKLFFNAVHDYNNNQNIRALKKLQQLHDRCSSSADRYAVTVFTALCMDDAGMWEPAAKAYRTAIQIKPESVLYSNLGLTLERLGQAAASFEAYQQAIRLDPGNPNPLNNLAQAAIRMGNYAEGMEYARQAIAINAKMPQALNAMTICSYMLGNMEDYETYYRQAVSNGSDGKKLKAYIQNLDATL